MLLENNEIKKSIEAEPTHIFFMTYRHGMNPFCFKGFRHQGDLRSARNRAFKHGEVMGYKNIWVMPMCVDLDKEESHRSYSGETVLPIQNTVQIEK